MVMVSITNPISKPLVFRFIFMYMLCLLMSLSQICAVTITYHHLVRKLYMAVMVFTIQILHAFIAVIIMPCYNPGKRRRDMPQKIMIIGAHPDDMESCGGTAVKLTRAGHTVQFLSATNGQSGHYETLGHTLVAIRHKEAQEAKKRLGINSYVILDNNDAYLVPDIPTRESMMKAIRQFAPDIIITHRLCDYHPDHRATSQLVQDCSYLVKVPNFLPGTPIPQVMPVIFYTSDMFQKPAPFNPDIVVDIDDAVEQKLQGYDAHTSQMYDWLPWINGNLTEIPQDSAARYEYLRNRLFPMWENTANRFRDKLIEQYGEAHGSKVRYAEAFEACEYGGRHDLEAERKLFSL